MSENIDSRLDPQRILAQAQAAFDRGDLAQAGALVRQVLDVHPNDAGLTHILGVIAHRQNDLAEAERLLQRAIKLGHGKDSFLLLAKIYESVGRDDRALGLYEDVLRALPNDYPTWLGLGGVKERLGDKPGARAAYQKAVDLKPASFEPLKKYTDLIWNEEPGEAVALIGKFLEGVGDIDTRAKILLTYVSQVEQWERIRAGLMPYHCTRMDELFFHYAAPVLDELEAAQRTRLAADPNSVSATNGLATARFCRDDRHTAEKLFHAFPDKIAGHVLDTIRFSPGFHDRLRSAPDSELFKGLPPLNTVTAPVPDPSGVLFLSCDGKYLDMFALPMVISLRENAPATPVHIHVMDASPQTVDNTVRLIEKLAPLRIALSVENPGLGGGKNQPARNYYHAIRFIRLYEQAKVYRCPLWMADVDAVVNRDLAPLFAGMGDHDVAMRVRPGRTEPWNQFNASLVGFAPGERSLAYLRQTAMYLAHFFQQDGLRWGIDQLAMYAVWADMRDRGEAPSVKLLDDRSVDYFQTPEGFIWCNSGVKKFWHLRQLEKGGDTASFGDNRYVPVFEKYWRALQALRTQG
ncbi:MAG: tetratricopeptide repeat protein [Rhodospirillaceae bacterium]